MSNDGPVVRMRRQRQRQRRRPPKAACTARARLRLGKSALGHVFCGSCEPAAEWSAFVHAALHLLQAPPHSRRSTVTMTRSSCRPPRATNRCSPSLRCSCFDTTTMPPPPPPPPSHSSSTLKSNENRIQKNFRLYSSLPLTARPQLFSKGFYSSAFHRPSSRGIQGQS